MSAVERAIAYVLVAVLVVALLLRKSRGSRRPRAATGRPAFGAVGLVAAREVRQRVRGRAFRVATVLVLLAVGASIVIPTIGHSSAQAVRVGVVGTASAPQRAALLEAAHSFGTTTQTVSEPSIASAEAALRAKQLDVVLARGRVIVRQALAANDASTSAELARAVARTLAVARAVKAAGLTPAQRRELANAKSVPVIGLESAMPALTNQGAAVTGAILIFVLLSQYLSWTLIGVMQEKANRVVEVLLAAIRPVQLLAGKLLGIGAVVFLQAAVVAGFALVVAKATGSDLLHGAGPGFVASELLWLVLGYAFYSWLYAAAGSLVERQDQVQSLAIPLVVPLVFGYVTSIGAASSGHASTLITVLAYLPPTAPFAMPVLVALDAVRWWQVVASAALTVASTVLAARLAAAVYRRAILRTGRRVRLVEVLRAGQ